MAEAAAFDPSKPFEAIAAPAFDPSKPFESAPDAAPSVSADIAKGAGVNVARGMIDFAGTPGDYGNLLAKGSKAATDYLADTFGFDKGPEPAGPLMPTSGGIQKAIESKTGEFYEPKTPTGKIVGSAARVAGNPLSYVGPGGIAAKIIGAAATGAGSEAAGEWAHEHAPALEPYARFGGGLLGGFAAGSLSATTQNIMRARGIPTTEDLHQAANSAYAGARSLGVEYQPYKALGLFQDIRGTLLRQGHRDDLSSGTFRRIEELTNPQSGGPNPNFSDIEGVRQSLNMIREEVHPNTGRPTADARAAGVAIDKIDDFLGDPTNAIPRHQAIAQQAADLANEGRGNWAAMSRSRQIEQALSKGELNAASTGSGANVDNALRQQVKQILNNPRRAKNFSADDRAIMRDIVAGNPVRNSARLIGKMAATGIVSLAGGQYVAHLMGLGPMGHVVATGAGYAGKYAGDYMTRQRINSLAQGLRMDSPLGRANPVPPRASAAPFVARSALTTPFGPPAPNPYQP